MKLKEKLAEDFIGNLLFPNRKSAKEAYLQGFKTHKLLVLAELTTYGVSQELLDKIADLSDSST